MMIEARNKTSETEQRTLWIVLILNVIISAAFFFAGITGDSSALIANGVDNLSDALVYMLSLLALGRGLIWKGRAALFSGSMLLIFAVGILFDVARRYTYGSDPIGATMMVMSAVAAVINYVCLRLLQRLDEPDVAMRAATTFRPAASKRA